MPKSFTAIGLEKIPYVKKGDDLAKLIVRSASRQGVSIDDGDVFVVGQKVVSKSEGRVIKIRDVKPSKRAVEISKSSNRDPGLTQLVLNDSKRVLKSAADALVVETRHGWVCLNAGVDRSNVKGRDSCVLLPRDPDGSAKKIRFGIRKLTGKKVSVIVSDTFSRPLRRGQVDFAIGVAGFNPILDYRGTKDLFGRTLKFKYVALADEIASAAELVMGQAAEGIPVAIIKGLPRIKSSERSSSKSLQLGNEEDLFSHAV